MKNNTLNIDETSIQLSDVVLRVFEILIKGRWIIVTVMVGINLIVLIKLLFFSPAYYSSTITILPESSENANPLSVASRGLFSITGATISTNNLYEEIIMSRKLMYRILERKFPLDKSKEEVTLLSILDIGEPIFEKKIQKGYKLMTKELVDVSTNPKDITSVTVYSRQRKLAPLIAKALVEELDAFNRNTAMQKAKENRLFIEERLKDTEDSLIKAEEILKEFREKNKRIEKSPQLQLEIGRLQRELSVQSEVFLTLRKEYELVKIEEVKNLPMLRILDEPVIPFEKSRPMRTREMMISIIVSFVIGISLALGFEFSNDLFSKSENVDKLNILKNYMKEDYSNLKKRLRIFSKKDTNEITPEIDTEDDKNDSTEL